MNFLHPNEPGHPHRHALALSIDQIAQPERFNGDAADAVAAMNAEVAAAVAAVDKLHAALQAEAMKHAPKMAELDALIARLTTEADGYRDQLAKAKEPVPEGVGDLRKRLDFQAAIIAGATDAELLADATDADALRVLADTARACKRQPLQEAAQTRLVDLLTDHAPEKLQVVEAQISELMGVRDRCLNGYRRAVESIGPRGKRVERVPA